MNDPRRASAPSDDLVRRLGRRYLLVLLTAAALIAADQAIIQPLLARMGVYAPVINLAGKQRMLSQRIVKAALILHAFEDEAAPQSRLTELRAALDEWRSADHALKHGAPSLGVPRIQSNAIDEAWSELQPHFAAMEKSATQLLGEPASTSLNAGGAAPLAALVSHEAAYLATMDRIVALMEGEAAGELRRLRSYALGIAVAIVALLVGVGRFVVRPATQAIRGQFDDLEERVASRTRDLDATLASLRNEIREREETESRNQSLAAQLAHANRVESMGHFAAGLAHELNQPHAAIANYAEAGVILLSAPPDEMDRGRLLQCVQQMQQASLRAGKIVRRIRNFVRPGAGNLAPVSMAALVQEVIDLCRPEATRTEVELSFELPPQEITVEVDAIQIQQVLVNLIQNALQAMEHVPPPRRHIVVRMATAHDAVQVDVADGGPGLANGDHDALFAPFQTTKAEGLGVGLSICRSIIEHHQGTIWAKSLPAYGAQFSFVLPLSRRHAAEHAPQPDHLCR